MDLKPNMRVLDMGCGTGLTSIFLAKEFGVTVFANDLWISATDNYRRFVEMNVADKVFPIHAEAHALPYAEDVPGGKSIWILNSDFELHNADNEDYLTLIQMTAIKR